ncbi:50S ribosomal protein L30 [bacterium]|nr:50S ribosomal protein L30 [bacterium]
MPEYLRVTLVRSAIGRNYRQKRVIKALGLRRLNYSRILEDNQFIRGMLNKVVHLLKIESVEPPVGNEKTNDEVVPTEAETVLEEIETPEDTDTSEAANSGSEPESETETERENDA